MKVEWLTCENLQVEWLTCKNLQVEWLTCKNLQVEWLTCKNLQVEWLTCKNLQVEWLTCKNLQVFRRKFGKAMQVLTSYPYEFDPGWISHQNRFLIFTAWKNVRPNMSFRQWNHQKNSDHSSIAKISLQIHSHKNIFTE